MQARPLELRSAPGEPVVSLRVRPPRPLTGVELERLLAEITRARALPLELPLVGGRVSPDHVELGFARPAQELCSLDGLLAGLARAGAPLGPTATLELVRALTQTLLGFSRHVPAHGRIEPRTVALAPAGRAVLLGTGQALLDALWLGGSEAELSVQLPTPDDDVRAVARLVYRALTGRELAGPLPGALPNPRRELSLLLEVATGPLPPDLGSFAATLERVLEPAPTPSLAALLAEYLPASAPRGAELLLLAPLPDPRIIGAPSSPVLSAVPAPRARQVEAPPEVPAARPRPLFALDAQPAAPPQAPAGALRAAVEPRPAPEVAAPSGPARPAAAPPGPTRATLPPPAAPPSKGRWVAAAFAATLALAGGTWFLMRSAPPPAPLDKARPPHTVPMDRGAARPSPVPSDREAAPTPAKAGTTSAAAAGAPPPTEGARRKGLLSITSVPSGASVEVDGTPLGRTPLVLSLPLEKQRYRVRVVKEGYAAAEQDVPVDPRSGGLSLSVTLSRRGGSSP